MASMCLERLSFFRILQTSAELCGILRRLFFLSELMGVGCVVVVGLIVAAFL